MRRKRLRELSKDYYNSYKNVNIVMFKPGDLVMKFNTLAKENFSKKISYR